MASGRGNAGMPRRALLNSVRGPRVRPSKAASPTVRPSLASPGVRPPAGAGSGIAKATTPMATPPRTAINRPKTGRPSRGLGRPRADGASRI